VKSNCSSLASNDKSNKVVCDNLINDVYDIMWDDFDFHRFLLENKEKYLFTKGSINLEVINGIIFDLQDL